MKFIDEFKAFALKGNVVDMAVGIIIGGAFGKIVTSLVNDIIMPPIGILVGGINFSNLKLVLQQAHTDANGKLIEAVIINYGKFIQTAFDFIIIAFSIFMAIKLMNQLRKKEEKATPPAAPPAPSKEELLLTEIRDILKERKDK